jgi:hypothetical protein
MRIKVRDDNGQNTEERRLRFRTTTVFDLSQTEVLPGQEPAPLTPPPSEPVTGDSHAGLLAPLEELAGELGYGVRELALSGSADGWCDPVRRETVVNEQLPANGRVRVLVHALGVGYEQHGRARAETIVGAAIFWPGRCRLTLLGLGRASVTAVTDAVGAVAVGCCALRVSSPAPCRRPGASER